MGDAQAFQVELRIEHEVFREVGGEQFVVLGFENVERERLSAFLDGMDDSFELSEHCLPEKTAADVVDLTVDDVGAHLRIRRSFKQVMGEQLFVKRGGHFRQKDRVFVVLILLAVLRVPAVHRMPGFMGESIDVGKDVLLVIHEDVRRGIVTAGGKRTAAFRF